MALSPLNNRTDEDVVQTVATEEQPTKTYALDLNENEIGGFIDGESALRQFVRKAIMTARFRFLIYDDQYGCEIEDLLGADVSTEFLEIEIPRVIHEALVYDSRISDVTDFEVTRSGDGLFVSFRVVASDGLIFTEEVTL
jgi:Protein of unknown function (DUF2634)